MISLLVDVNIDGHVRLIEQQLRNSGWSEYAELVDLHFVRFDEVGLAKDTPDDIVWRFCQQEGYWLITANRNGDSDDSLEATMQREGTFTSLPVITISNATRLFKSKAYLEAVIAKLFEFLINAEQYLGSGRLYVP